MDAITRPGRCGDAPRGSTDAVDPGAAMSLGVRSALGLLAAANLVLALAYAFQAPWALSTWPWTTGRLTYIFIGSIFAAIGAGVGWVAVSGETGSMPAGFADLAVTLGGGATYLIATASGDDRTRLILIGAAAAALALANVALAWWSYGWTRPRASPRVPRLLWWSYVVFVIVLAAVGLSLVLRVQNVMPWPLDDDMSVVIGFIFLGNAVYFGYAVVVPHWSAARAQLWSFLAYDVVLIGPLLAHYADAPDELRLNVVVYSAVLVYSAALAIYFLFIDPTARVWARSDAIVTGDLTDAPEAAVGE
jgi:hypothetical protein